MNALPARYANQLTEAMSNIHRTFCWLGRDGLEIPTSKNVSPIVRDDGRIIGAVRVHMAEEVIRVSGDARRIVQVVTNVLNNAAKYKPEGGQIARTVMRVAMTGYSNEAARERAIEAGFDRHMIKPLDVRELS